jgi:cysteine desulfurase
MGVDVRKLPPLAEAASDKLKLPIYMDHHATTPIDPRVLREMLPYLSDRFGNAASRNHSFGWTAEKAVATAREQVANLIGASSEEVVFTSGATESDNLAIQGAAESYAEGRDHIITLVTEHKAVLDTCKRLERRGFRVTYLPVRSDGLLDLDTLDCAIDRKTLLVTIMAANNEIGVLQPIAEVGKLCRERGIIFHSDAAQAAGKVPIDVVEQNLDLVSMSAHKMYGPKGVGALYVRHGIRLSPIIEGGGQEQGMRSGTLNVPGIVGFGKACAIASDEITHECSALAALRNRLSEKITAGLKGVSINGSIERRLPGNLNMSFAGVRSEDLMTAIDSVAVSSGAACTSAHVEPSYVLKALGVTDELAESSIRFGLGRFNTEAEVDYVAEQVIQTVTLLRQLSTI